MVDDWLWRILASHIQSRHEASFCTAKSSAGVRGQYVDVVVIGSIVFIDVQQKLVVLKNAFQVEP